MASLRPIDRLLLGTVTPIFLVVFTLHVRAATRTGLAQPGFFVTNPDRADAYPHVGGARPEQGGHAGGLLAGDRLIQAGDVDLRGVGNIGFDAVAISEGGASGRVRIEFERGGQRRTTTVPLVPLPIPWMRIPMLLTLALTALLVLLRAGGQRQSRFLFAAFMGLAILQSPFHGGSLVESYSSKLIFYAANLVVPPLMFSWLLHFPSELPPPSRALLSLPWLFVPVGLLVRGSYVFGAPIPTEMAPRLGPALDGLVLVIGLLQLTVNYRRVDRVGRRRIKWVLYGAYLGGLPSLAVLLTLLRYPQGVWFSQSLVLPAIAVCAMPLGVLVAIVRHNLFDIDRLISATASYSALAVFLAAGTLTIVPALARVVSTRIGIDVQLGQLLISLALAAIVVPAEQRLRPAIDNLLFPERRAFEQGIRQLLSDLSGCDSPWILVERAGESLDRLLQPRSCVVYGQVGDHFVPVFTRAPSPVAPIESRSPLIRVLERRVTPVAAESSSTHRSSSLSPFERAALEELGVSVLAPVRGRAGVQAFFSLGRKRSGDVYTSTDVAWLSGVSDRMSAELLRFNDDRPFAARLDHRSDAPSDSPTLEIGLLRECPECGTCYSEGTWTCEHHDVPLAAHRMPRCLMGRYRLDRRLGRGGMGTVYEARDLSLGRHVAVKIIREDMVATLEAANRFTREARATAGFAHPNVVVVHDFGVATPAIPFLVLELLKGCSLREEEERGGQLPPQRVITITRSVCDVLTVAHRRALVHRDLKPENVFLARQEDQDVVKVLDFGLAKFRLGWDKPQLETHPGVLVGTLAYMAPECFRHEEVHPSWDLWSLGVMVYEMLAGKRPFSGDSAAVQRAVLAGQFDPISRYWPAAPSAVHVFLARALAPSRNQRAGSADQFFAELELALR